MISACGPTSTSMPALSLMTGPIEKRLGAFGNNVGQGPRDAFEQRVGLTANSTGE
jgi:hypothetical protein